MSTVFDESRPIDATIRGHIEVTPGVCGGRPRVAGRRVRVQDIVLRHEVWGMTADEILLGFPGIELADIYAALVYYHDNTDRIRADMKIDEERIAAMESQGPSIGEKIRARHAENDSLSP